MKLPPPPRAAILVHMYTYIWLFDIHTHWHINKVSQRWKACMMCLPPRPLHQHLGSQAHLELSQPTIWARSDPREGCNIPTPLEMDTNGIPWQLLNWSSPGFPAEAIRQMHLAPFGCWSLHHPCEFWHGDNMSIGLVLESNIASSFRSFPSFPKRIHKNNFNPSEPVTKWKKSICASQHVPHLSKLFPTWSSQKWSNP